MTGTGVLMVIDMLGNTVDQQRQRLEELEAELAAAKEHIARLTADKAQEPVE